MTSKLNYFINLILTLLSTLTFVIAFEEPKDKVEACKFDMKKYCNSEEPKPIDCAKGAILNYRDNGTAPNYIDDYFKNVIFPNTRFSGILGIIEYCSKQDTPEQCTVGLLMFPATEIEEVFKYAFYKKELNLDEINDYARLYLGHISDEIRYDKKGTDVVTIKPFVYCETYNFNQYNVNNISIRQCELII